MSCNRKAWTVGKRLAAFLLMPSLIPDSFITFISGICLAAAINIATSQIPNKLCDMLPLYIIFSMILMFASSVFFMILAVKTKEFQDTYKLSPIKGVEVWLDIVCPRKNKNKPCKKKNAVLLILFTVMAFGTGIIGIVLLV
jgi:hypothetical protein